MYLNSTTTPAAINPELSIMHSLLASVGRSAHEEVVGELLVLGGVSYLASLLRPLSSDVSRYSDIFRD